MRTIDRVTFIVEYSEEFEGRGSLSFSYTPASQDEPLALAVRKAWQDDWEKQREKLASLPVQGSLFF